MCVYFKLQRCALFVWIVFRVSSSYFNRTTKNILTTTYTHTHTVLLLIDEICACAHKPILSTIFFLLQRMDIFLCGFFKLFFFLLSSLWLHWNSDENVSSESMSHTSYSPYLKNSKWLPISSLNIRWLRWMADCMLR